MGAVIGIIAFVVVSGGLVFVWKLLNAKIAAEAFKTREAVEAASARIDAAFKNHGCPMLHIAAKLDGVENRVDEQRKEIGKVKQKTLDVISSAAVLKLHRERRAKIASAPVGIPFAE